MNISTNGYSRGGARPAWHRSRVRFGWLAVVLLVAAALAQLYLGISPVVAQQSGKNWVGPYWLDDAGAAYTQVSLTNLSSSTGTATVTFRNATGQLLAQQSKSLAATESWSVNTETGGGAFGTFKNEGYVEITSTQPVGVTGVVRGVSDSFFIELSFVEATLTSGTTNNVPIPLVPAMSPLILALGAMLMFALHLYSRRRLSRTS